MLFSLCEKKQFGFNMNSPLISKSFDFASDIVVFFETFSKSNKDTTIAKQLLRSGTSIGANLNEAIYGNSKADFIAKLHISLKETSESIYWLMLLKRTQLIDYDYDKLIALAEEIKRMLISSINTSKVENKHDWNNRSLQFLKWAIIILLLLLWKNTIRADSVLRFSIACSHSFKSNLYKELFLRWLVCMIILFGLMANTVHGAIWAIATAVGFAFLFVFYVTYHY